jgi:hypothetical protein
VRAVFFATLFGGMGKIVLLAALAAPGVMRAGFCPAGDGDARHDIQMFAGYSPATATLIGTATDRQLAVAGMAYSYRCWIHRHVSISYTATLLPAMVLFQPAQFVFGFGPAAGVSAAHAVYGFGVAPLGFTFEFARRRRVYPFAETIEGLIASTEPIPELGPNATGLNFLFDLGGGIRIRVRERQALSLGYRFLHVSNADTTNFNPGLDNNVFYVGYSFSR